MPVMFGCRLNTISRLLFTSDSLVLELLSESPIERALITLADSDGKSPVWVPDLVLARECSELDAHTHKLSVRAIETVRDSIEYAID